MAKDSRIINRGIRINDVVYKDGQEDEVQAALSESRIAELIEEGSLSGEWIKPKAEKIAVK